MTPTPRACLSVKPLTPSLGAEISGVDLGEQLAADVADEVREAFARYHVLFFRDQVVTHEQHIAFGKLFGPLDVIPIKRANHREHPELLVVRADANSKFVVGEDWHSDMTCLSEPPLASALYLETVPPVGGDTVFANVHAAYDALSEPLREFLSGLSAFHTAAKGWDGYGVDIDPKSIPTASHPVICQHPGSGRPYLAVNEGFTTHIEGIERGLSDAILGFLFRHVTHPRFGCRFTWTPRTMVLWDNYALQHHAVWDYYPQVRSGHRVTIKGGRPLAASPVFTGR